MKKQLLAETVGVAIPPQIAPGQDPPLPEYLAKFRTKNTIPAFFREAGSLPDRLAVVDDKTPAIKAVNQSYERQKKIEQKRAIENAIQKVANISQSNEEKKSAKSSPLKKDAKTNEETKNTPEKKVDTDGFGKKQPNTDTIKPDEAPPIQQATEEEKRSVQREKVPQAEQAST